VWLFCSLKAKKKGGERRKEVSGERFQRDFTEREREREKFRERERGRKQRLRNRIGSHHSQREREKNE
jgi:hypothetical protein